MSTFEKIQDIIAEQLDKEKEEITLTTHIKNDLEADSLDLFQVINDIEDEFEISIDTEQNVETVAELVNYVESQIK